MLDIQLNVARLNFDTDGHGTYALRDLYPELTFVWDRVDSFDQDLRESVQEAEQKEEEAWSDRDRLLEHLREVQNRLHSADAMVQTMARMGAADPLIDQLAELSDYLDDSKEYVEKVI